MPVTGSRNLSVSEVNDLINNLRDLNVVASRINDEMTQKNTIISQGLDNCRKCRSYLRK